MALNLPQFSEMKVTTDCGGGSIGVGFHQFDFSIHALQVNKYGQLGQVIASTGTSGEKLPTKLLLHQNYPNPFNPTTTIRYQLPQDAHVVLKVYDILGREVATLVNKLKEAGFHSVIFQGNQFSSGVYFYRLQAGTFADTKKFIFLR